ncbi:MULTISPECIES: sugar-binding transcriptional regulator [unclassified Sporolactobacillus]|uniref:sugar-binding transcriptional regulator n=1 Tax=unclassified Sporolactobacillus TaxID=2628533 RepID=UPI0023679FFB|nr:sugar-binding transcriptional regulator [Sporolactobacillus sp. CQH2019]MDD9149363.1 sugar-binding transcriptional regulator [Sporolactobacillus sp. CQH2019]
MEKDKRRLLTKVAYLYYIKEKTQNEIAGELGIYRTTISRMLKKARSEGIVDIQIRDFDPQAFELEVQLQKRFALKDAVVIPTGADDTEKEKEDKLAEEAAYYLKHLIKNDEIIGLSWGSNLAAMIGKLKGNKKTNATFVPLVGGPSHINSRYHVNAIIYDLSRHFGGECVFINAGAIQDSRLLRDGIMKSRDFQKFRDYWNRLDIAMFGIGGPLESSTSSWRNFMTQADQKSLINRHAIGDCCCQFFDSEGRLIKEGLYNRTIGIKPELLAKVPYSVGVARSKVKAPSIRALLKTDFMNTLITDDETVREILK